jgi:hypothetical protein
MKNIVQYWLDIRTFNGGSMRLPKEVISDFKSELTSSIKNEVGER